MGALVPIAGGALGPSGPAPFLRVIPGGAAAAGAAAAPVAGTAATGGLVGAAGAVGGVVGPVAAVLGAFALGFKVGEGLLALWELLNRNGAPGTPYSDPTDTDGWPTPNPGQTVFYGISVLQQAEPWPAPVGVTDYVTGEGKPFVTRTEANGFGPGLTAYWWKPHPGAAETGANYRVIFRLNTWWTSDGLPPVVPLQGGEPAPSRSGPLEALQRAGDSVGVPLPAPLAFIPPAPPVIPSTPSRAPVVTPAPVIAPAPAPRPNVPAGQPGPATAPGALPAITPGPGQAPAQQPLPSTFPQVDPLRPPVPIGPAGVPVVPAPLPVPVTPPDIVTEGGIQIGDAGARPRPDLDSIAREMGRQEQKLAGLLSGLGYPEAFDRLLDLLTSINTGGSYSIRPACGTDANGNPLPPIEVPIQPTIGDNAAIIARLDAIAELIDHHKQLRQPICKGKPTGESVTVTFVESE